MPSIFVRRESAFTLLEVMVSMVVFSIMTLGIVPLIASSMHGSVRAQMETAAENATRRVLEHIEGIKWYSGYDVQPPGRRVDLLDLYFPLGSGAAPAAFLPGQSYSSGARPPLTGTGGIFTTSCPPPSGTNPACGFPLPAGYSATIDAAFVAPNVGTSPETYAIVTPPSTYAWNVTGKDTAPAKLLDLNVRITWTRAGVTRSFQLRTLLSDRHFQAVGAVDAGPSPSPAPPGGAGSEAGGIKISGQADIDYGVLFNTGYSTSTAQPSTGCPTAPCYSDFTSAWGISHSQIRSQDVATASQSTSAGLTRITRAYPASQAPPASPPADLATHERAKFDLVAPPAVPATTVADAGTASTQVRHPDFGSTSLYMSFYYPFKVTTTGVDAGQNPYAQGSLTQTTTSTNAFSHLNYQTQANQAHMHLNPNMQQLWTQVPPVTPLKLFSLSTSATTGALGAADRGVHTRATQYTPNLQFLMLFLDVARVNSVFLILNEFNATVDCKATANPATATATASWSATLTVVRDATPGDKKQATTSTLVSLGSTKTTDPLAAYGTGSGQSNPLLYDPGSGVPVYLFNDPATGKLGLLESWSSETNEQTSVSADGRSASASINGAIQINTTPVANTGPANALTKPETAMNLSVGKLSCNSVDNR